MAQYARANEARFQPYYEEFEGLVKRPAFEPQVIRVYRQTNIRVEIVNLAVEKRYQEILNEHRRRLADWCRKTGDRFAEDDGKPGRANIPGLRYVDV